MIKIWAVKPAQAIAEMAIMSTLLLVVFGMIIATGQRYDKLEELKMRAFRKALAASYVRNAPVSYSLREDARGMDLFSFGKGQALASMGYASVMWQKGMAGTTKEKDAGMDTMGSYAFYEVNGKMIGELQGWDKTDDAKSTSTYGQIAQLKSLPRMKRAVHDKDGYEVDPTFAPVGIYKEESQRYANYTGNVFRGESAGSITNTDNAATTDMIASTEYLRGDDSPIYYRKSGDMLYYPSPNLKGVNYTLSYGVQPLPNYKYCEAGEDCSVTSYTTEQAGDNYTMQPGVVTATRVDGNGVVDVRYQDSTGQGVQTLNANRSWTTTGQ